MFEKIFFCLIVCSKFLIVINWKPTTDYCKQKCWYRKGEHTACNCKVVAPREIIEDNMKAFRQDIVNVHNHYRNLIASGGEKDKGYPEAANMMTLSYNLELEYIAKCYAGVFVQGHDGCRKMVGAPGRTGQNVAGTSDTTSFKSNVSKLAYSWYDELNDVIVGERSKLINGFDDKYAKKKNEPIGHFTQFVWWSHKYVGCARVHNEKNTAHGGAYVNGLICNYGGASKDSDSGNLQNSPVYKSGPKCSACPGGTACNSDYPALCGTIAQVSGEKVPLGKPSSRTVRIYQNKFLLVIVLLVLCRNLD